MTGISHLIDELDPDAALTGDEHVSGGRRSGQPHEFNLRHSSPNCRGAGSITVLSFTAVYCTLVIKAGRRLRNPLKFAFNYLSKFKFSPLQNVNAVNLE